MKAYDFHYSIHEVDGKEFELIECSTWPRLNVQVIHTTPERFEEDLKIVKSHSLCGYSLLDRIFILKYIGGEGNGELRQSNLDEIFDGINKIANATVKWRMVKKNTLNATHNKQSPLLAPPPRGGEWNARHPCEQERKDVCYNPSSGIKERDNGDRVELFIVFNKDTKNKCTFTANNY